MAPGTSSSRLGRSTAFVGLLLVGALALSGLLAYQAFDANRSHAEAVRKTLGEQAQFAAWEYANTVRRTLDSKVLYLGLDVVASCGGKVAGAPIDMASIRQTAAAWDWSTLEAVDALFRLDLATGHVESAGKRAGADLTQWVRDAVLPHFERTRAPGWQPRMMEGPGSDGFTVYRFAPDDRAEAEVVYGFVLDARGLEPHFSQALASSPLLPEGLTGGRPNEEVFAVSMERGGKAVWTARTRYDSDFEARDTLGTRYAGLTARVVVNPEVAPSLVIGGLPKSRLPLILILLALTAGLVAGAFLQLRRETELAQLRADFVSGVSHELRTPLAQIRMFGETLLLDRVRSDEERRRSLEIIVNESQRLTHQVGNVLLYSHTERDGVRADPVEVDVRALVDEVVEAFRPLAQAAGHRLETTPDDGTPVPATVDPSLVRQALLNLLDNAVKYGSAGQTIRVGNAAANANVQVWVEDEGPGVPERERSRIWQPYFRMARHRESSTAGSGIGLSVVREVAEAHGGRAFVEAAEAGGARFVLELPRFG